MTVSEIHVDQCDLETPAFVYDERSIAVALNRLQSIATKSGCKILFSLKAFTMSDALRLMIPALDGFAASSLFEAQMAAQVLTSGKTLHLTTPGLKSEEVSALAKLCDFVSFNSLSQWNSFSARMGNRVSCGLRINPQLSYVRDVRYDPCRSNSKLGVPLSQLINKLADDSSLGECLRGIHCHNNCEAHSTQPLLDTVNHICDALGKMLKGLEWVNLGGGYLFNDGCDLTPLYRAIEQLKTDYGLEVFLEPGEAIIGGAGHLVSTVIDMFDSDGKTIAILDTTINHLPGVFTYQTKPLVGGAVGEGEYKYLLAGNTCLAGDLFGEYEFRAPLTIGSRIRFDDVGGYSLVKANMFNGINLPTVYSIGQDGHVTLRKRYTLQDFLGRWTQ